VDVLAAIAHKRDGARNSPDEIAGLVAGAAAGTIPDYQLAAWLMAVVLRGMDRDETLWLTEAMVRSGEVLDVSSIPGVTVDKHSTGGVGDKVTLIACPLAASLGVAVPKLSGRSLAHTGGTLDKLESVPGFDVDLGPERFLEQVRRIGIAIAAQSARIVPADRALYALRDVTATVPSIPLIASSVLSKKLAAGARAIVLDVKFGRGAFMPDLEQATELARLMVEIGTGAGRQVVALLTAMEAPLGRAIGNALEVREAFDVLDGHGDKELTAVSVTVAREMCALAGVRRDPADALRSGAGSHKLWQLLEAQGASSGRLPEVAPATGAVRAERAGWVGSIDALEVGTAVLELGGGRRRHGDSIDHGVGVVLEAAIGARVTQGDVLCRIHARSPEQASRVTPRLARALTIVGEPPVLEPHVRGRVPEVA
jgi:pyrimidine-nucleoside phosphorylase